MVNSICSNPMCGLWVLILMSIIVIAKACLGGNRKNCLPET